MSEKILYPNCPICNNKRKIWDDDGNPYDCECILEGRLNFALGEKFSAFTPIKIPKSVLKTLWEKRSIFITYSNRLKFNCIVREFFKMYRDNHGDTPYYAYRELRQIASDSFYDDMRLDWERDIVAPSFLYLAFGLAHGEQHSYNTHGTKRLLENRIEQHKRTWVVSQGLPMQESVLKLYNKTKESIVPVSITELRDYMSEHLTLLDLRDLTRSETPPQNIERLGMS